MNTVMKVWIFINGSNFWNRWATTNLKISLLHGEQENDQLHDDDDDDDACLGLVIILI
jgi:hypothetical protein